MQILVLLSSAKNAIHGHNLKHLLTSHMFADYSLIYWMIMVTDLLVKKSRWTNIHEDNNNNDDDDEFSNFLQ